MPFGACTRSCYDVRILAYPFTLKIMDAIAELDTLSDPDYLAAFDAGSLPPRLWTHYAHIRMAWLVLRELPFPLAVKRIRSGILNYNTVALGRPEAYHESITLCYAHLIAGVVQKDQPWPDFVAANPDLFGSSKPFLGRFYSQDKLFSDEARQQFVLPDRVPLPQQAKLEAYLASVQ